MSADVQVDFALCLGCGQCVLVCPADALECRDGLALLRSDRCTSCEECVENCPVGAVRPVRP